MKKIVLGLTLLLIIGFSVQTVHAQINVEQEQNNDEDIRCEALCSGGISLNSFPNCEGTYLFPNVKYIIEFGDCCCPFIIEPEERGIHELPGKA